MHRTHAGHGSIWPAETVEARAPDQSSLTPEWIAELRGLAEKATPGPWERVDNAAYALNDEGTNRMYLNVFGGYEIQRRNGISVRTAGAEITANAALIAAMRNALPDLLDAAERAARAREDALREAAAIVESYADAILALIDKPKGGDASATVESRSGDATSPGVKVGASASWQPIETAPLNEYVLVYLPDASEEARVVIAGKLVFEGDPDPAEWWEISVDTHPNAIDVDPSHWMPLPAAPVDGGEDA